MNKNNYKEVGIKISGWISDKVKKANCDGAVIGLSGGIDSSLTAALTKEAVGDNILGLIMPCHSNPEDLKDAKLLANKFAIDYQIVNLEDTFNQLLEQLGVENKSGDLAVANIKARLRMTTLYFFANQRNSLVVGTGNKSELETGYFTKYGDGGVDIEPLGGLLKTEVKKLAKQMAIPEKIIKRKPSAGLWEGQSDEEEIGISYQELDEYILTGEAKPEIKSKADKLIKENRHKLKLPLIPNFNFES